MIENKYRCYILKTNGYNYWWEKDFSIICEDIKRALDSKR